MNYNDSFVIEILRPGYSSRNTAEPVFSFNNVNVYIEDSTLKSGLASIENDNLKIFLDGNFYLRNSDSINIDTNLELFLCSLNDHGMDKTREMIAGGLFNIFAIDKQQKQFTVLSDFLGAYPVYYSESENGILISGNQFNLSRDKTINNVALIEFLKYGYLPYSDSFFNDVLRKSPWEMLTIDIANCTINKTEIAGPKYAELHEEYSDVNVLSENFKVLLKKYFLKFHDETLLIGLSGGYDSRLITAFLKNNNIKILNFMDLGSSETDIARNVVELLNLNSRFNIQPIPADLILKYGKDIRKHFRIIQSLEMIHVINLEKKTAEFNCRYYVDGFIGDTVIGSSYFFELKKSIWYIIKYLFGLLSVKSSIKEISYYKSRFYNLKDCLDDSDLGDLITPQFKIYITDKISNLYNKNYFDAKTNENMVESLNYITRARNLIAGGPAGINNEAQCCCPFIDRDIFELSLKVEKKLKIGNKLYNQIWRICFPELSHIRKAGQKGCPKDSDFIYRLKHIATSIYKNMFVPFINRIFKVGKLLEEVYFTVDNYVGDDNNKLLFEELEKYSNALPRNISEYIINKKKENKLNKKLYLRYISLISYLKN